jgi:hypothetical protein
MAKQVLGKDKMRGPIPWGGTTIKSRAAVGTSMSALEALREDIRPCGAAPLIALQALLTMQPICNRMIVGLIPTRGSKKWTATVRVGNS